MSSPELIDQGAKLNDEFPGTVDQCADLNDEFHGIHRSVRGTQR